jgi:vitamin B12/bleomycin/antimicrobial peptide transport system ATP-binding/permease protein
MTTIKNAWHLSKGVFKDKEYRSRAILFALLSLIFELLMVALYVVLNKWHNTFYNALQNFDGKAIRSSLLYFAILVLFFVAVAVIRYVAKSKLEIHWRKWMTEHFLQEWVNKNAYYGNSITAGLSDNPDQRISEDIKSFVKITIVLTLDLLSSIVSLVSFVIILWSLSGIIKFSMGSINIGIHGYLVWAAIIYALIGTYLTYKIGKNLPLYEYLQEKKEANFRFSLMRFRENAENVALYDGVTYEKNVFKRAIDAIVENFNIIISVNRNINLWVVLYNNLSMTFPLIIALPRYLAKEIQLGGLMQIASAFNKVQDALSFLINSFSTIALYRAVINRLVEFEHNINNWQETINHNDIKLVYSENDGIKLENLSILSPKGDMLLNNLNLNFKNKEKYLITGRNGCGKSTLLKAIRGIWPFGSGVISLPKGRSTFFIPQKTYMPSGTLLEIIAYPNNIIANEEKDEIVELMNAFNISYLIPRFDNEENWSIALSLGEQQKIAIIRALLSKPDILIMDESTSAITEADESIIFDFIKKKLSDSILISIGHRLHLKNYHTQEIKLICDIKV